MELRVQRCEQGYRLIGAGADVELANRFLTHLVGRNFAVATRRAYAFDLLNFLRFCQSRGLGLAGFRTSDLFDYLDWQASPVSGAGRVVVRLAERSGAAPATVNRRVAAVRGMFEFVMLTGGRADNPVPVSRRVGSGHSRRRGLLGHLGASRHRTGGRLVVQPQTLPESLDLAEVRQFVADLGTARDRAVALAMLLGGLRAAEVRSLLLADVDFGMRRLRVTGKGGKERMVPVGAGFFTEVASYLRRERPPGCPTPECFVVLRGPDHRPADD